MNATLLTLLALLDGGVVTAPGTTGPGLTTPLERLELRDPTESPLNLAAVRRAGLDEIAGRALLMPDGTPQQVSLGDVAFAFVEVGLRVEHGLPDLGEALAELVGCRELADDLTDECEGPLCADIERGLRNLCAEAVSEATMAVAQTAIGFVEARLPDELE